MYKIFIAEDEHLIRESIRNQIDHNSNELHLNFCGEAGDGELALSMMLDLKPDILITDIKMPFMNGLQLAKEAKRILPWLRVIFISGFDEFDYAKSAIQLGADDYLLKPIKESELVDALYKAIEKINEQQQLENSYPSDTKNLLVAMSRNNYLESLFNGQLSVDKAIEKGKELHVDLAGKKYTVLLVSAKWDKEISDYHKFYDRIEHLFEDNPYCIFSTISTKFIKFLVFYNNRQALLEKCYQIAHTLLHELDRNSELELGVTFGPVVSRISEIKDCFETTKQMMRTYGVLRPENIISYEDDIRDGELSPTNPFKHDLILRLSESSKENIPNLIEELSYRPNEDKSLEERHRLFRYFILHELLNIFKKEEIDIPNYDLNFLTEMKNIIAFSDNLQQYHYLLKHLLEILLNNKIEPSMSRYRSVIQQALNYIDKNFNNPDISLNSVADEVALSPSHFSTIFSQAMNVTFIEYITTKRINLAKKLLRETDEKLSNIAFEIGYCDPNYFSYLFKKKENVSPTEYRKQIS